MDLNLALLGGRLAAIPEARELDLGAYRLRLLVTVHSDEPRRRIDVIPVTLWDADPAYARLEAGQRVWVSGSVQRRFWEGPDGRRSRLELMAQHIAPDPPAGPA